MSKPPDPETLARQYLELWQSQLTAMAADPDMAEAMGRMMAAMAQVNPATMAPMGPAAMNPAAMAQAMWPGAPRRSGTAPEEEDDAKAEQSGAGQSAGPAAAAAAPGDGDDAVARLERRVAELEERLDRLERKSGPKGRSPKRSR